MELLKVCLVRGKDSNLTITLKTKKRKIVTVISALKELYIVL